MTGQAAQTPGAPSTPLMVDGLRALRVSGQPHALLDVRELPETDAGHIPGASTVPLRVLALRIEQLVPTSAVPIVLVDGGGDDRRALAGAAIATDAGYHDVRVLDGGLAAWDAAGLRVERGRNVPSKRFGELLLEEQPDDLLVDPETAAAWIAEGRVERILDVRTAPEHERECIPGSEHASGFDVVAAALGRTDPDRPLIVHCTGRTRGIVAASTLRMLGVRNVHALENGTMGWRLAGLELEHGARRTATTVDDVGSEVAAAAWRIAEGAGVRMIAPRDAHERIVRQDHPTLLIDVRPTGQHLTEAPVGSLGVPSGQLVQQLDDHLVVTGAHAILIDDGPLRAAVAAHWLRRIGVADVSVVAGGIAAWRAAGLPMSPVHGRPLPERVARAVASAAALTPDELERHVAAGASVLSIATSGEHSAGHVPGARWMLVGSLLGAAAGGRADDAVLPDGEVVLTCADGALSAVVAQRLAAAGRGGVRSLAGGVAAWRDTGRDLATASVVPDAPDVIEHPIHIGPAAMQAYLDWELALEHGQDAG